MFDALRSDEGQALLAVGTAALTKVSYTTKRCMKVEKANTLSAFIESLHHADY